MKHEFLSASLWLLVAACAAAGGDSLSPPSQSSTTVNSTTTDDPGPLPPRYAGPPPDDPSPEPAACSGGPTPTVFLRSPSGSLSGFALSATHVYWSDSTFGIYRQPKVGGDNERVAEEDWSGDRLPSIVGSQLYWSRYPGLYRMPLEGGTEPVLFAGDVTGAWTVSGSTLYYMSDPSGTIVGGAAGIGELRSVPLSGGASRLIAADQWSSSALAADTTGVYWFPDVSRSEPRGGVHAIVTSSELQKYSFASNSVRTYATMGTGVHLVQTVGERVVASDSVLVWSSAPDGSGRIDLGQAPFVHAITSDGSSVYWAASTKSSDPFSDIVGVPLGGGEPQTIGCHLYGVEQLLADESALYYQTRHDDQIVRLPLPNAP